MLLPLKTFLGMPERASRFRKNGGPKGSPGTGEVIPPPPVCWRRHGFQPRLWADSFFQGTIRDYVTLLERIFLLEQLPPWHSNRLSRLIRTPKLHIGDTGLAAALLGLDAEALRRDRAMLGKLRGYLASLCIYSRIGMLREDFRSKTPGRKKKGTWYNAIMPKKPPLSQTNPYLRDPAERRYWVLTTVASSAAIEGIHLSKEELVLHGEAKPTFKRVYGKSSGSRR
jgi:hypothetical protein